MTTPTLLLNNASVVDARSDADKRTAGILQVIWALALVVGMLSACVSKYQAAQEEGGDPQNKVSHQAAEEAKEAPKHVNGRGPFGALAGGCLALVFFPVFCAWIVHTPPAAPYVNGPTAYYAIVAIAVVLVRCDIRLHLDVMDNSSRPILMSLLSLTLAGPSTLAAASLTPRHVSLVLATRSSSSPVAYV
jgi:hypothetical protein